MIHRTRLKTVLSLCSGFISNSSSRIPHSRRRRASKASALITTLLVLVVLSTIVVAFMQSMSVERSVARSMANRLKAEQVAEAGLSTAVSSLQSAIRGSYAVAQDRSGASSQEWQTIVMQLSPAGLPTNTQFVERLSSHPSVGSNRVFDLGSGLLLSRTNYALTNSSGDTNGSFAYAILDNGSKQALDRFPNISPRAFSTTVRELPLISTNGLPYSATELQSLTTFAGATNSGGMNNLFSVPSIRQFLQSGSENSLAWFDTSAWSPLVAPDGSRKIDLRRLKFYIDTLASSQTSGNPKSSVVNALAGLPSVVDPVAAWGGGTLGWLVNPANPNSYTAAQARQIAANLIDYLDSDLHPTSDNIDSPSYIGVEGRLQPNGSVLGHPYVTAVGFGLIFNFSAAGGFQGWLNSTRVLAFWSLANPWSSAITYTGLYSVEAEIEMRGTASGGTLGPSAQSYFLIPLDQRLTEGLSPLPPNSGSTYPQTPSGLSFANLNNLQPANRQPRNMQFNNVGFVIKKMRLRFTDSSGLSSFVQVLDPLSAFEVPMNPRTFTLPAPTGGNQNYNPGTTRVGLFLGADPRQNFLANSWISGNITSDPTTSVPPQSNPRVAMFSGMSSTQGDGQQGVPDDETWYSSNATTNHFFVRSPPEITNNPLSVSYNPAEAPTNLAVDSIAEIGYLWSGVPWQTLRMVEPSINSLRSDYRLLDYIEAGTMPRVTNSASQLVVNGLVNPNTASDRTLRSVFTGIPGLSSTQIGSIVSSLRTNSTPPYPFVPAGVLGQSTNVQWPGATTKFTREALMRRIANTLTTSPNVFTVFVTGEARDPRNPARVLSRANIAARIQFTPAAGGGTTASILSKTFY